MLMEFTLNYMTFSGLENKIRLSHISKVLEFWLFKDKGGELK